MNHMHSVCVWDVGGADGVSGSCLWWVAAPRLHIWLWQPVTWALPGEVFKKAGICGLGEFELGETWERLAGGGVTVKSTSMWLTPVWLCCDL